MGTLSRTVSLPWKPSTCTPLTASPGLPFREELMLFDLSLHPGWREAHHSFINLYSAPRLHQALC